MEKTITLNDEEQKILWIALNNLQHQGLHDTGKLISSFHGIQIPIITDWAEQTRKEYEIINQIKLRL